VTAALLAWILISAFLIALFENWTYLHAAYFTVINVTTVGFGDIVPATHRGKILAGLNSFAGLIAFGVLITVITTALQPGEYTGTATPDEGMESKLETDLPRQRTEPQKGEDELLVDFIDSLARLLRERGNSQVSSVQILEGPPSPMGVIIHVHVLRP